jgi:hypothetical protein
MIRVTDTIFLDDRNIKELLAARPERSHRAACPP